MPENHSENTSLSYATFWKGPLSLMSKMSFASFVELNIPLTVYTYDPELYLPVGIEVKDAREIIPDKSLMSRYIVMGHPSPARFANLFRYEMLRQTELCWVDADIICKKTPQLDAESIIFGRQQNAGDHAFNNAVLKFPNDHPVLTELIQEAKKGVDIDAKWGTIGPSLLTKLIRKHDLRSLAKKQYEFYAIPPGQYWKMLLPEYKDELLKKTRDSTFIHLWNEMFKVNSYDFTLGPPIGSFLHDHYTRLIKDNDYQKFHDSNAIRKKFHVQIQKSITKKH